MNLHFPGSRVALLLVLAAIACSLWWAGHPDAPSSGEEPPTLHPSPPLPAATTNGHLQGHHHQVRPTPRLIQRARIRGYEFQIWEDSLRADPFQLVITRGEKRVFNIRSHRLALGNFASHWDRGTVDLPRLALAEDITGRGRPEVVVSENMGGARSWTRLHIFELSPLRELPVPERSETHACIIRLSRGRFALWNLDSAFVYWNTCYANSPLPRVILTWQGHGFHLETTSMRSPLPSKANWVKRVKKALDGRHWPSGEGRVREGDVPLEYWCPLLDLIYGGHVEEARAFSRVAWPPHRPGRAEFLRSFLQTLAKSVYFQDLDRLTHGRLGRWYRQAQPPRASRPPTTSTAACA